MSQFQFIKSIDQINDVAIFIDTLIKDHQIQFVLLEGQIGSGKSTLVRTLAQPVSYTHLTLPTNI